MKNAAVSIAMGILMSVIVAGPAVPITPAEVWQEPWDEVPEYYRHWAYPDFTFPEKLPAWKVKRGEVRAVLERLLGDRPSRPNPLEVETVSRTEEEGYVVEKFVFDNGLDSRVPGYLIIPDGARNAPAVLVMHGHGSSKENILGTEPSSQTVGPMLARAGFVVMAIDSYFNGERRGTGPAGSREMQTEEGRRRANQERSLFKMNLWFGRSLWGLQLRDEQIALDYLVTRPEVDANRIGASGMSMGSTRSWWLAAIDERIKGLVGIACFTRYKELIEQRALSAHGIYYFVPGILQHFDMEAVMGLIAPRPFLALTGDSDRGSPLDGIRVLESKLDEVYSLYGEPKNFESVVYPNTGHVYNDDMKGRMLAWFKKHL
ncbi:alpha/beta hydrolase [candidate division KSB1 bacterium]